MAAVDKLNTEMDASRELSVVSSPTRATVGLLIENHADRRLLELFIAEMGYAVVMVDPRTDVAEISNAIDLLFVDQDAVDRYQRELRVLKRDAGSVYLPMLVLLPEHRSGTQLLQAGFDDVLRVPIGKSELSARLDVFLRVRAHSKAQYQSLVENALIGIYRASHDGRVVMANQALARMLGYQSSTDLIHAQFNDLMAGANPDRREFWAEVALRGAVLGLESTWWRRDGRALTVWESARVIVDERGAPVFFEGTVEDITRRKEFEAMERRNEGRFRALIERNTDTIAVVDRNGVVASDSPPVERALGYALEEWVGQDVFRFVAPEDVTRAQEAFTECLSTPGVPFAVQVRVRHADGSWRTFETVGVNMLDDPDVEGVVINARDVSERVAATEALRLSENRLRALIDSALDAVLVADDTGRYVDANPAACRLLGVSREELLRRGLTDFVDAPDVAAAQAQYREFLESGRQEGVFSMRRSDGATIQVEFRATANFWPGLHLSVLRDATERIRTERLLRESEERFRTIFASAAIGIGLFQLDGTLITCNRAFEQMVGYSESELKVRGFQSITHPDDLSHDAESKRELREGERTSYQREKRYIRRDGQIVWARLTVSRTSSSAGGDPLVIAMAEDITDRVDATRALRESEERFRAMFQGAAIGIGLMDSSRRFIACNPALQEMLGYSEAELIALERKDWIHPDDVTIDGAYYDELMTGIRDQYQIEKRYRHSGGQELWGRLTASLIRDESGKPAMVIGMLEDITDRKRVEQQLVHDAFHDPLTGLPNRALFIDRLDHLLLRRSRRTDQIFAVLFLDLDRFKVVNDSLGHLKGDQLLVTIAQRLRSCVRPDDTVARLGGDEFTILLEDLKHPGDATRVADRILDVLRLPVTLDGVDIYTNASIGIALSSNDYEKSEHVLRDADAAMYYAKSLGRSRYEIFDARMHVEAMTRLQLETELRHAVEHDEFTVRYQPIISLHDGGIGWFEALIRWRHPRRGLVGPDAFIPLAEETGLIHSIDRFVLREACRQMRAWLTRYPDDPRVSVSVNLSGKQFNDPELPSFIESILKEEGIEGHRLRLEITESMVIGDVDLARRTLAALRQIGVHVHIDDFGTGYSSLSVLHSFALNKLKIDRTFVQRMGIGAEHDEVVVAVVALAHGLGLHVIAEGIETTEQLARLREIGCDYGQGYFFAPPVDSVGIEEMLGTAPSV